MPAKTTRPMSRARFLRLWASAETPNMEYEHKLEEAKRAGRFQGLRWAAAIRRVHWTDVIDTKGAAS